MTTNYTHFINDNLDMFDMTLTPSLAEEAEAKETELAEMWEEMDAEERFAEEEERFAEALREQRELVMSMDEADEGYAMAMAVYSDMYKDMYGHRPYGIGLRYHGA